MKKALALILIGITTCSALTAQTPQKPDKRDDDEVLRITTELVQVDAVYDPKKYIQKNESVYGFLSPEHF